MKKLSTKVNYVLNFIRIVSATLVGLIMMPYVNRVLGVNNIGKIEYAYTIINYFLMFSAIGIPIYGIREIAKVSNDIIERTKVTLELFVILLVTTIIAYISLFILLFPLHFFFRL
ncbi:oligosaccharide flippase family protein [Chryseobacterium proteolyticum]|uniref:oligosaccharide flippase family protein n=1 Tax=Chryseobacterium proteolyticum TaxID=118127 RepID=UPI00398382AB